MKMIYRIIVAAALIATIIGLTACGNISYYYQATKGQLDLLRKRTPVSQLINDRETPEPLRQRLILADQIRRYGISQLGLEGSKGFSQYSDLGRKYVTWNIVAAPEYSVNPKTWCFPIAGCVAYKGFFKQSQAIEEADLLRDQGYDILLYGVSAYSTLGWFADPLLNTFINYPDTDLAALLFHELAHQIVYVKDDSAFNEAFATAVEIEVLNNWLIQKGNQTEILALQQMREKQNRITEMVLDFRQRLKKAYQSPDKAQRKVELFAQMREAYEEVKQNENNTPYYDWWFSQDLDNADLIAVATYYRLVPAFSKMIENARGNLAEFFNQVKILANKSPSDRDAALARLSLP